jgi:hypothetical protein
MVFDFRCAPIKLLQAGFATETFAGANCSPFTCSNDLKAITNEFGKSAANLPAKFRQFLHVDSALSKATMRDC